MNAFRIIVFFSLIPFSVIGSTPDIVVDETMSVNLIELDVKVVDLNDRPVRGLTADDFIVRENGKIQNLSEFSEIDLTQLSEEDQQEYQPRTMILLDLYNTPYNQAYFVFEQLKSYARTHNSSLGDLGLSVITDSIGEVQPFTNNPEEFAAAVDRLQKYYRSSRFRNLGNVPPTGIRGLTRRDLAGPGRQLYRDFQDSYYKKQTEMLAQFVRYLGAYSGKKNVILISNIWEVFDRNDSPDIAGSQNLSLKDIQTTCLYNKVAINVIGISGKNRVDAAEVAVRSINQRDFQLDELSSRIANVTSGFFLEINNQGVDEAIENVQRRSSTYYRLRYYSSYQGDNYRRVRVTAKGFKRIAYTFSGYIPKPEPLSPNYTNASVQANPGDIQFEMDTDWLAWTRSGWGKHSAHFVMSHLVLDDQGAVIAERVSAGVLEKRKREEAEPIKRQVALQIPSDSEPERILTRVVDLTSGERFELEHEIGS